MLGGTYSTGTISVANGSATVTGIDVLWNDVLEGDELWPSGHGAMIIGADVVTPFTSLTLMKPWPGTTLTGSTYVIVKTSWKRHDVTELQKLWRTLAAELEATGNFIFVEGDEPDPEMGENGQWALKTNVAPWSMWFKEFNVWEPQAVPVGGGDMVASNNLSEIPNDATARTNIGALAIGGGTMTGLLTLSGAPSASNHAATKAYVDTTASAAVRVYHTFALAQAATIPAAVLSIELAGYYAAGDFGRARYVRVATQPAHPGKLRSTDRFLPSGAVDAGNGGWWALDEQVANVHMFGARGDGTTDDTTAVSNANLYVETRKSVLEFFHCTYIVSTLTIGGEDLSELGMHDKLCTWRGVSYDGRQDTELQAVLKLKAGTNGPLVHVLYGSGQHNFERLYFDGNKGSQTSGICYGVVLQADTAIAVNEYHQAPWFKECIISNCRTGGLYIGRSRANGRMIDCVVSSCGNASETCYGVFFDSYDWNFTRCNFYGNGETYASAVNYNLYVELSTGVHFENCNFFYSKNAAIYLGPQCWDITFVGGSVDQNWEHGVMTSRTGASPLYGGRIFMGVRFYKNGIRTNNTYADVTCIDAEDRLIFVGCHFDGAPSGNQVINHLRFSSGSAHVQVLGCRFVTASGVTITLTNNVDCILTQIHGSCVFNGNIQVGSGTTGLVSFGNTATKYLQYTGSQFTLVGERLQATEYYQGSSANRWSAGQLVISSSYAEKASGTTWANPSDARIKDVLGDYTYGLDVIKQIVPKRYEFRGNHSPPGEPQQAIEGECVGLIAQDVENIMPGMVTLTDGYIDGELVTDFRRLDVSELTYALLNAVKELAARVEQLESGAP